ncbi:DeoR/GlpR family DNA-binding transcription regulator [Consotaella aegiceratis]|uniref:DeoR/GlpR family DNA-binding transcription regulator n=1 Tax=Consotaella aegiceratis TaxID=3097961 RepID=UPI002F3F52B0
MLKEDRFQAILEYIDGKTAVSYREILAIVDVSAATLRRDVAELEEGGLLRRVRGGVAPVVQPGYKPLQSYFFRSEQLRNMQAKDAIAGEALSLCEAPDTVILFSGTTVARFAERLPRSGLTILTNSLPVANVMAQSANRTFITCGEVLPEQGVILSPLAENPFHPHLAASTIFIGCHAVSQAGILEDDPVPIQVFRSLRKQARRLVVLADSSKFLEGRSLVLCPLSEVDVFVTDDGISDESHRMLIDAGVTVLVAPRRLGRAPEDDPSRTAGREVDAGGTPPRFALNRSATP